MRSLLNSFLKWRENNKKNGPYPGVELICRFGLQCLSGIFIFQMLIIYLAHNFHPTDAQFVGMIKEFPALEIFLAIIAVAKFLGLKQPSTPQNRLISWFSLLILLAIGALHFVPSDMAISGASQSRQTAVFAPLVLLVVGYFGIAMNLVWSPSGKNDAKHIS